LREHEGWEGDSEEECVLEHGVWEVNEEVERDCVGFADVDLRSNFIQVFGKKRWPVRYGVFLLDFSRATEYTLSKDTRDRFT